MKVGVDLTRRGTKRIYSHHISTIEAFKQAIHDMRIEAKESGQIVYEGLIKSNPKNIHKFLPSIDVMPLNITYCGTMPIPLTDQRKQAINMLKSEIKEIDNNVSFLLEEHDNCRWGEDHIKINISKKINKLKSIKSKRIKELNYIYSLSQVQSEN